MSDEKSRDETPSDPGSVGGVGKTYGHFRIIEQIGHGGMGVVHKATDVRLDRVVALKFLPSFLDDDVEARARFTAEAKAASALDDPHICVVHEIGESEDGQVFIAMAYYEGETLAEKIDRGPLAIDEAVSYADQVARGLATAHAAGIVHRDIKPANVMVTPDGVVKILDFGLAKLQDVDLTRTGSLVGTVQYMSPEHAGGDSVDHRTDLWSLGVVLYEMLAGQHPFGASRAAATMYGILNSDPPSLSQSNPRVPLDIERIVNGCLAKDPDRRYQSAGELLADLERSGYGSGSTTAARGPKPRRGSVLPRHPIGRAGIAVAAALALALAIPASRQAIFGGGALDLRASQASVAVLPLSSTSGLAADEALANGITYSLATMLVGLETERDSLRVVPASEIVNQSVTSAREASQLFEVNLVLQGNLSRGADGQSRVTLELMEVDPINLLDGVELAGPEAADFQQQVRAALGRLFQLGQSEVDRVLARAEPVQGDAYRYYIQGLGYLHRSDLANNIDNAIQLFDQALAEDSAYALAWAGLCEAQFEQFRVVLDTAYSRRAIDNCDVAADLAGDQASVLTALGSVLLRTGEPGRALERLQQAVSLEPDNAETHRWLGRYYEDQGSAEGAEEEYDKAIALRPESWTYHHERAVLFMYGDRVEEAEAGFQEITRLTPDNYLAYNGLGFTSLALGRAEEATGHFRESIRRRANPIAYRNLGYLNIRVGQWDDAIDELETGLAIRDTDWWSWRWLGHARYWSGDEEGAREAWQRAIELVTPIAVVNPGEVDLLMGLAEAHVLLGDLAEGRRWLDQLVLRETSWNYIPYFAGRVYEILGDRESAIQYVTEALDAGFDPVMIENDPWIAELRGDPRYQAASRRATGS